MLQHQYGGATEAVHVSSKACFRRVGYSGPVHLLAMALCFVGAAYKITSTGKGTKRKKCAAHPSGPHIKYCGHFYQTPRKYLEAHGVNNKSCVDYGRIHDPGNYLRHETVLLRGASPFNYVSNLPSAWLNGELGLQHEGRVARPSNLRWWWWRWWKGACVTHRYFNSCWSRCCCRCSCCRYYY